MKKEMRSPIRPPVVRWFAVAACVGVMMALAAAAMGYQQQMQTAAERIGESMTKTGKKSVAVVDFTDLQGNATELGRFLAEQLSVALSTANGTYEVIDRNHLRALLQEHKLSATGLIDPLTARKVGQMAGAECLASGSITPFSESVNLSIKLLDTNTAKILGALTVDIPRTSTINELLAKGISAQLVSEPASPTSKAAPASPGAAKASPVTDVVYGVEVSIVECKKAGKSVSCHGTLRNGTDATLRVAFRPFDGVDIIDNLGNQSRKNATFGQRQWEQDLEPDLPVRFWINDVEVATEATSVTTRITVGVHTEGIFERAVEKVVVLRGIPLR
jgi:TolB-like protein